MAGEAEFDAQGTDVAMRKERAIGSVDVCVSFFVGDRHWLEKSRDRVLRSRRG